ncbi:MAG: HPr kinase/phosphorylase [Halorhodospira sp.]
MSGKSASKLIPGVLVVARGYGVLLEGPSGAGKSDAALALLDRGHTLVADDAVRLQRDGASVVGHCPDHGRGLLYLRDLGTVDITDLYPGAFQARSPISLCIRLEPAPQPAEEDTLLHGRRDHRSLLSIPIPRITLTGSTRRPLAPLIEAAAGACSRPLHRTGEAA